MSEIKSEKAKDPREIVTLSDDELIGKSYLIIGEVSRTHGKAWKMSIPPSPNNDSDFVLTELVDRYRGKLQAEQDAEKRAVEAHTKFCQFRIDGTNGCGIENRECTPTTKCKYIKSFKQHLTEKGE